jgi:ParB-like chromosome segregation protein Spo0J
MDAPVFKDFPVIDRIEALESHLKRKETPAAIKEALGLSRHEMSHLNRLRKNLAPESRKLIRKNKLSEGHARALARLSGDPQVDMLRESLHRNWSVRALESRIRDRLEDRTSAPDATYYEQLSLHVADTIGHPVKILPDSVSPTKGKIVITYYGLDEFDSVMQRLKVSMGDE